MKKFEFDYDFTGFDDAKSDPISQKMRMQKEVDKFNVEVTGIIDYGNCYSCTFTGTKTNLLKMLKDEDLFGMDDDEIEDIEFQKV
jgi:hypothetical protein